MKVSPPSAPPLVDLDELVTLQNLRAPHAAEIEITFQRYRALLLLAHQPALRARLGLAPGVVARAIENEREGYRFAMTAFLRLQRRIDAHIQARTGGEGLGVPSTEEQIERLANLPAAVEVP